MGDPHEKAWDVAIVGAGMGGSALAYSLALSGRRVLIIERGAAAIDRGAGGVDMPEGEELIRLGQWPDRIKGTVDGVTSAFLPSLGCGLGGSTLLYAAALERFQRDDFQTPADGEGRAPAWPVPYDDMAPFYRAAEERFRVRGGFDPLQGLGDPLRDPDPLNACDRHFFQSLRHNGMHPYRLHVADTVHPDGRRMNARDAFLEPALETGNVSILTDCTVERIEANGANVTELLCRSKGHEFKVKAGVYALAAGALSTPVLMLNSASPIWPSGVANSSGMVGRNLMFHLSDFIAVWPRRGTRVRSPTKAIGLRDFYSHQGSKLGQIQSTGLTAGRGNVLHFLRGKLERSRPRLFRLVKPFLHIPAMLGSVLFGRATIFASIMEDYPYPENRVVPGGDAPCDIHFHYTVHEELKERIGRFRHLYRAVFARHRMAVLSSGVSLNLGHACGTCRFGDDPKTSVLDKNNRSHDISNLFVVDGSFFPSSGGTNPSLTIAANALRVGLFMASLFAGGEFCAAPIGEPGAAMEPEVQA